MAGKHRQLQAIIDNSPLVIYAKDASHRYQLANRELEVQLGLPPGGAVGRTDFELLPEPEAERRRAADQGVLDTARANESEELLTIDGRERAYLVHRFPLRESDGTVYAVCGIGTDVTERREREDDLRAKLEWSLAHPPGHRRGPAGAARPADRGHRHRRAGPAGAAGAHARRGRRARDAGRVPAAGRALPPGAPDRPLGDRPGRPAGQRPPRRGEPVGPEHGRRLARRSTWRPQLARRRRRPAQRGVRDHRDRGRPGHRAGHPPGRAPVRAGLRIRAGRLRHRLRQLHLPEAPAGGLHQDRHRVRARPEARLRRTSRW